VRVVAPATSMKLYSRRAGVGIGGAEDTNEASCRSGAQAGSRPGGVPWVGWVDVLISCVGTRWGVK